MSTKKKEEKLKNEEITEEKVETENEEREEKIKLCELEEKVNLLEKEKAEADDKYLRLYAEYDNYKKRTAKEKDEIYFSSKCDVLKKLFPVIDNLERAEKFSEQDNFEEGVKLIIKQFFETLESLDVHEIECLGKEFDPNVCEAVCHDENKDAGKNTVTEVFQKGYISGEKVLRHAMVKVSN